MHIRRNGGEQPRSRTAPHCGLDFDGGIFTNLTRDHLDYHKTFANYLAAKKSFFDGLKPEAFALTNLDDRNGEVMQQNTRARKASYSLRGDADFRGRVIEDRFDGMLMSFNGSEVETLFCGRFNASNLLAVYGAAQLLGFNRDGELPVDMSRLVPVADDSRPYEAPTALLPSSTMPTPPTHWSTCLTPSTRYACRSSM